MNAELLALVQRRIRAEGGWLPFDAFMAEVLYAPGLGYYCRPRSPIGSLPSDGSDFVTAPEMSPLFGRAVGRQVAQALGVTQTQVVYEFGAGSGALAEQLLSHLDEVVPEAAVRYCIVDLSASLRQRQQKRLARFGDRVRWLDRLPDDLCGVVVGNEVLDAMPVKLLHFDGQLWQERGIGLSETGDDASGSGLCWIDRPSVLQPPCEPQPWVAGTVTELHEQACAWIRTVASRLHRGAIFLIDYGFGEREYYHPQRLGGTLMCHQLHRADPDPLRDLGDKDITAHVNFTAIALAGQEAGLQVLGYTSQGRFLLNAGIASDLAAADTKERVMGQRLVNEHEMGELFKVLAFSDREHIFDALGFQTGDRTHRL